MPPTGSQDAAARPRVPQNEGNISALMQSCAMSVNPDFRAFGADGQSPGEIEQAAAQSRVVDPIISADQLDRFSTAQRIGVERFGGGFGKPCRDRRRAHRIHVVKEE